MNGVRSSGGQQQQQHNDIGGGVLQQTVGRAGTAVIEAAAEGEGKGGDETVSSLGSDMDSQLRDDQNPEAEGYSLRDERAVVDDAAESQTLDSHLADIQESDSVQESSDSQSSNGWVRRFLAEKGNEFFCEIDDEYIGDRFNLTGLNTEVDHYQFALDLLSDNLDERTAEHVRDQEDIQMGARHLYGLIHSRFIITHRGLSKMADKFRRDEFGRCPRVLCQNQAVLPVGLSDVPEDSFAKVYCPRCEDVYTPTTKRHARLDGSYFGTSFPHLLFQVFPNLMPAKAGDRYVPRIFGFKIHDVAVQHRRQDTVRERKTGLLSSSIARDNDRPENEDD